MRPVTVEFTVTCALDEATKLTAGPWVCGRCGDQVTVNAVRAHLIGHAHEDIGVPS